MARLPSPRHSSSTAHWFDYFTSPDVASSDVHPQKIRPCVKWSLTGGWNNRKFWNCQPKSGRGWLREVVVYERFPIRLGKVVAYGKWSPTRGGRTRRFDCSLSGYNKKEGNQRVIAYLSMRKIVSLIKSVSYLANWTESSIFQFLLLQNRFHFYFDNMINFDASWLFDFWSTKEGINSLATSFV